MNHRSTSRHTGNALRRGATMLVLVLVLVLAGGLAACDRGASTPESESTVGPIAEGDATVAPAHVALDGDGIRIVAEPTGRSRPIAFGTVAATAIGAVTGVLGVPIERSTNAECGPGPMEFVLYADGMMLNIQDDRFVGWTVRPGSTRAPTTMSGIGLGATRAQLDSAYSPTVRQSSIGTEFSAGGVHGLLESAVPAARITDMWAGLNCIAR
ncbi:MAG: hypothetical protein H0X64_04785 [Gemmatimonadaceae bacterium]|nr:hypothetical protein [Gemmatimonadaceae bacterium]